MSMTSPSELQQFALFIQAKLQAGEADISPEEALDQWREENPSDEEFEENVRAIQEALDQLDAGVRGISIEALEQEFLAVQRARAKNS
jgi:hypothetical protein